MGQNTITVISLIVSLVGIPVSAFIAWFYYKKSIKKKELTPYLISFARLTNDFSDRYVENIYIEYDGVKVDNLVLCQFLIKNTGQKAISNSQSPLKMVLYEGLKIIDSEILRVTPKGRNVSMEKKFNSVIFKYDLLNESESFLFQILLSGDRQDLAKFNVAEYVKFTIVEVDLPPKLNVVDKTPWRSLETSLRDTMHLTNVISKVFKGLLLYIMFGGVLFTILMYKFSLEVPYLSIFVPNEFFKQFTIWKVFIILGWLMGGFWSIVGLINVFSYWVQKKKN